MKLTLKLPLSIVGPSGAAIIAAGSFASFAISSAPGDSVQHWLSVIAGSTVVALTLAALAGFLCARSITRRISSLTETMQAIAGGNYATPVAATDRVDELDDMAEAAKTLQGKLIEARELATRQQALQERQMARSKRMEEAVGAFDRMITDVVGAVTSAATQLQLTAQSLSATAEETSRQTNAVAAASEQMTQNVQTVASATEELSASIREIASQVTESGRIVGGAVSEGDNTNAKVKDLSEAARKIGEVVTLINKIAAQTNLLALNATIEAARAGDAGKGFAVVASEVKNLAMQTASATEEIAGQVRAIQESTERSTLAIQGITQTINRVNEISTAISAAVEEQSAATMEISRNVLEVFSGTAEVNLNITGVTVASQQTSTSSTQVLLAAGELAKNGERLRNEVEGFLRELRAC